MEQAFVERLIDFGALGIMTLAMGFILWQYWKRDKAEKERLIKRLEECNDTMGTRVLKDLLVSIVL
jgi:hypothetical protein